jgi:predicted 3-demethylubiquinone-9 3-methyltransferase (glyoxalase superfamily)
MPRSVTTFMMFDGVAEEAMNFYVSLFKDSTIRRVERWAAGEQGKERSVKRAEFSLCGHDLIAFDSPVKHEFTFTPSISLFVECETEAELDAAYAQLSAGGKVLMPLDAYGFSKKFGWVNDRFGVSWQLNLA